MNLELQVTPPKVGAYETALKGRHGATPKGRYSTPPTWNFMRAHGATISKDHAITVVIALAD
jgi:hypothetical protein